MRQSCYPNIKSVFLEYNFIKKPDIIGKIIKIKPLINTTQFARF